MVIRNQAFISYGMTGFDGLYFLFTPGKFSSGFDTKKKQGK
jgi:hypothetical protein